MAANPKQLFENLAEATWERLYWAVKLGVSQGEETITDINLLEIARPQNPCIKVFKVDKKLESQMGIDWEWWVGNNDGWLRFALQAKVLKQGRYHSLGHYVKDNHGAMKRQADILETYANKERAIPLYCFYNHVTRPNPTKCWHCCYGTYCFQEKQLGCTLVTLPLVQAAISKRGARTFSNLHSQSGSLPWRCLFCTDLFSLLLHLTAPQWHPYPEDLDLNRQPNKKTSFFTYVGEQAELKTGLPAELNEISQMPSTNHPSTELDETTQTLLVNYIEGDVYPKRIMIVNIETMIQEWL